MIYIIGSLRSARPQEVAEVLREAGHEVFDDWQAGGPIADDSWRDYERARGRSFKEALKGPAARNIFEFDKRYLDAADIAVLVLPAGKSAHLELGYFMPKPTFILLDDPERWDVMYQFATGVTDDFDELKLMIARQQVYQSTAASAIRQSLHNPHTMKGRSLNPLREITNGLGDTSC